MLKNFVSGMKGNLPHKKKRSQLRVREKALPKEKNSGSDHSGSSPIKERREKDSARKTPAQAKHFVKEDGPRPHSLGVTPWGGTPNWCGKKGANAEGVERMKGHLPCWGASRQGERGISHKTKLTKRRHSERGNPSRQREKKIITPEMKDTSEKGKFRQQRSDLQMGKPMPTKEVTFSEAGRGEKNRLLEKFFISCAGGRPARNLWG